MNPFPEFDYRNFIWSKSSLSTFLTCSKAFKYQYIDRKQGTPNKYMVRGSKIHKYIEQLNRNQICIGQIPDQYKQPIINYINFLKVYDLPLPIYVEQDLKADLENLKFRGFCDAIYVSGDRGIVVDYKSGKGSTNIQDYRMELQLYSYLTEQQHHINVVKYGTLFVDTNVFLFENNDHSYGDIIVSINKMKKIAEDKLYSARNFDQTCNLCSFKDFCDSKVI